MGTANQGINPNEKKNQGTVSSSANQGLNPSTLGTSNNGSPSNNYNGYGGYGGYGGGGGSSAPNQQQKDAQGNLGGVAGYNAETAKGKAANTDKIHDINDEQNKSKFDLAVAQVGSKAAGDWYTQQQKMQNSVSQLADASGNAMYGSFYDDFNDLVAIKDDMDDVELLKTQRENANKAAEEYYAALMASNNARNELYADTEESLRSIVSDYAAQSNNIHPDLAKDIIDAKGHTLNAPDWLKPDYFSEHVRDAIVPEGTPLYRLANDAITADREGLISRESDSTKAAGNTDYWSRMRSGYNRRGQ